MMSSLILIQSVACVGVALISSTNIIMARSYRKKVKKATMKGGI